MNFAIPWDFRVTLDLFLGGLGVGVFLTAILGSYINSRYYSSLIRNGLIVAPVAVGIGVIFLLTELGRPERFLTILFHFNPSSVMSWGAFLQVLFMLAALILAWQTLRGKELNSLLKGLGTILALGIGFYHGALLTSSGSNPLWNDGLVPVMFFVSSVLTGCSVVLLLHSFGVTVRSAGRVEAAATAETGRYFDFRIFLVGLLAFQMAAVVLWMVSLSRTGLFAQEALQLLLSNHGGLWWAGFMGIGLVVPLVLVISAFRETGRQMSGGLMSVITLSILIGSFIFKQLLITAGQIKFPVF